MRGRRARKAPAGLLILVVLAVSGCGGAAAVDRGGFTGGDRKAAQKALAVLGETAVWTTAAKATYTQGFPATKCVVHIRKAKPLTFDVFMIWIPESDANRTYTWLRAVIGADGLKGDYKFDYGNEVTQAALESHYDGAFAKPVLSCLVLQNRQFALLPAQQ